MVVLVVAMVVTMVVSVVGRQRGGVVRVFIVSVLWGIIVVSWLLRVAEPWSVAQGARFEYLRDGFFYEVAVRLWVVM